MVVRIQIYSFLVTCLSMLLTVINAADFYEKSSEDIVLQVGGEESAHCVSVCKEYAGFLISLAHQIRTSTVFSMLISMPNALCITLYDGFGQAMELFFHRYGIW